jgi:hypothetical protein
MCHVRAADEGSPIVQVLGRQRQAARLAAALTCGDQVAFACATACRCVAGGEGTRRGLGLAGEEQGEVLVADGRDQGLRMTGRHIT